MIREKGKRKKAVNLLKTKKSKTSKMVSTHLTGEAPLVKPNYFARYRFNLEGLINYLKTVSGKSYLEEPLAFQCLEDLGHWSFVRQSPVFEFTPELDKVLRTQFHYLEQSFTYQQNDILLWGDLSSAHSKRFLVQLEETLIKDEIEIFRVKLHNSGATTLVSRYELDYWNAPGSSLPVDSLSEVIDWDRDYFWLKKLNDFKNLMVAKQFKFDFSVPSVQLHEQRQNLFQEIQNFFQLTEGPLLQHNRGLGLLSCGQGEKESSALVFAFALQALAQPFGISARLWGRREEFNISPAFVFSPEQRSFEYLKQHPDFLKLLNEELNYQPIQRSVNEVLRRVTAAPGPFGLPEAPVLIRRSYLELGNRGEVEESVAEPIASTSTEE